MVSPPILSDCPTCRCETGKRIVKNIRVLIAMLGLDQHEVGAIAVAGILRDAGMEVVYAGRFNLPRGVVKTALEESIDVIGLSAHSWEYLYYLDELLALLREQELDIPIIVGGSVVTPGDAQALLDKGVRAAFGPTATPDEIIATVKQLAAGGGCDATDDASTGTGTGPAGPHE